MYYFIVNPQASNGRGRKIWEQILKALRKAHDTEGFEAFLTEKSGDARMYAQRLSEKCQEQRIITVIGGEGTLNEVVDGLHMDGDLVSVAYIPTKADNDMARCFRRRYSLKDQLQRLGNATDELLLDYGVLDCDRMNRRFAVSSGIGFDAEIFPAFCAAEDSTCTGEKPRMPRTPVSYFRVFAQALLQAHPTRGYVVLDGTQRREFNHILFISAHVHPYDGGYRLCPQASGEDGCLDICIVSTKHRHRLLWIMLLSIFGAHVRHNGVHFYRCREAVIHTEKPLPVHVDGESLGTLSDFSLRCIPKKLRLRL